MVIPFPVAPGLLADAELTHRRLAEWRRRRLAPTGPDEEAYLALAEEHAIRRLELDLLGALRGEIAPFAAEAPRDPDGFVRWFEALRTEGPGQVDPLFSWLAREADLQAMRWFLTQEVLAHAEFEALLVQARSDLPQGPRLQLAADYWQAMGAGVPEAGRAAMLGRMIKGVGLRPTPESALWQSLALANLAAAMAGHSSFTYHALGALGVVRLTGSARAAQIDLGLARLGVGPAERGYFSAEAQEGRPRGWCETVLAPLVAERPDCAPWIAEGALMWLMACLRCSEAYRSHLWDGGVGRWAGD